MIKRCKECGIKEEKLRRGMCLRCYRIITNFSGGDGTLTRLSDEVTKIKQRILLVEAELKSIPRIRKKQ